MSSPARIFLLSVWVLVIAVFAFLGRNLPWGVFIVGSGALGAAGAWAGEKVGFYR